MKKTTYAWIKFAEGFLPNTKVKEHPRDIYCAWCKKSQVEILNEHIQKHSEANFKE